MSVSEPANQSSNLPANNVLAGRSLWQDALSRLQQNKLAMAGLYFLGLIIVIAIITPWIAPYSYETQNLDLGASITNGRFCGHCRGPCYWCYLGRGSGLCGR